MRQLEKRNNGKTSRAHMDLKKKPELKGRSSRLDGPRPGQGESQAGVTGLMDPKKKSEFNSPDGQKLGRSSRLDGPRSGEGEGQAGDTGLMDPKKKPESTLSSRLDGPPAREGKSQAAGVTVSGPGMEKEKTQPEPKNQTKNAMHASVSSQQIAKINKGKDKVKGDSEGKNHGRMNSNRKESHNKTQTDNMQVTNSICSVIRGNTLLVQKPMERNREPEPPDEEDVWMDEGHEMDANGLEGETMEGIETPVVVNLLEEWEVREDNP
ncbi:hypothetical protein OIU79_020953 [Salix purpurea]|uniref:Uncharacterized protein n=1 Tax=Salix purpurea TaxID=77065 RepID=A0A9Q0WNM3_SALPP|nr:hypothetical protein OIU79_020953 [Salix purpurea]